MNNINELQRIRDRIVRILREDDAIREPGRIADLVMSCLDPEEKMVSYKDFVEIDIKYPSGVGVGEGSREKCPAHSKFYCLMCDWSPNK